MTWSKKCRKFAKEHGLRLVKFQAKADFVADEMAFSVTRWQPMNQDRYDRIMAIFDEGGNTKDDETSGAGAIGTVVQLDSHPENLSEEARLHFGEHAYIGPETVYHRDGWLVKGVSEALGMAAEPPLVGYLQTPKGLFVVREQV